MSQTPEVTTPDLNSNPYYLLWKNTTPEEKEKITIWWKTLMAFAAEKSVTDIHFTLTGGEAEIKTRINTVLESYSKLEKDFYLKALLYYTTPRQHVELHSPAGGTDFAISIDGRRLRVNCFRAIGDTLEGVFRPLPNKAIEWQRNKLTAAIMDKLRGSKQGLILVTGPTGSGKSTTICSMIEYLNEKFAYNIITIEDPVEYIFTRKKALIRQREVGDSTDSFETALRHSLRQNPDIIFIGEIRDYKTAKIALQAADTGHLVFATLHTRRVYATISRLLEMAPAESQNEMRTLLANSLLMVMCQRLLKRRAGGIVPCREIMTSNVAISSLIRAGKEKSISGVLITKQAEGMMEWQKALDTLVDSGEVDRQEAQLYEDETEKMG
jgi:twitching motility protein PilT